MFLFFRAPIVLVLLFYLLTEIWSSSRSKLLDPQLFNLASSTLPSLLLSAKASSTTSKYQATWRQWVAWAESKSGVQTFPVKPFELCLYISHLSNSSGAKTAANAIVAAIKWVHNIAGLPSPTDNPMVKSAVQGYNRVHASPTLRKEPITPDILQKLLDSHGHPGANLADLRLLFVCFVSYAGFLRFDDLIGISRKNCSVSSDRLIIHLEKSKTDQFRQGADVVIARTYNNTCPVQIAERYFNALGDPVESQLPVIRRLTTSKKGLLPTHHGLSYTRVREIVREALRPIVPDVSIFGLHSFRSGGATAAGNALVPAQLISQHGRWKTEKARNAYIQYTPQNRLIASKSLGI